MSTTKKLWLGLAALLVASFSVMLWLGADLHQTAPDGTPAFIAIDQEGGTVQRIRVASQDISHVATLSAPSATTAPGECAN